MINTLTQYVQCHRPDAAFLTEFQSAGQRYLNDALQVMTADSQDRDAAIRAVEQLKDLRSATFATMAANRQAQHANAASNTAQVKKVNDEHIGLRAEPTVEKLRDFTVPERGIDTRGRDVQLYGQSPHIGRGNAYLSDEIASMKSGQVHDMANLNHFAKDLGRLIAYVTASTTPGPLGQALALSNIAHSRSRLQGSSDEVAAGSEHRALSFGSGAFAASGHSEISASATSSSEPTATRVFELIDDLQTRLAGATVITPGASTVTASSTVRYKWKAPFGIHGNKQYMGTEGAFETKTLRVDRQIAMLENQPPYIEVPTSAYQLFADGGGQDYSVNNLSE